MKIKTFLLHFTLPFGSATFMLTPNNLRYLFLCYKFESIEVSEARRHPKIITHNHPPPNLPQKKEYEFNEYEFPSGNSHPVGDESGETDGRQEHEQEHEHEAQEHVQHHHHEHHEHVHVVHPKHISHHHILHPKKPGYSAGSGLRSIAQGSADQASSAVNNQVRID